jgi:dsDNA-specific endonuclease/ATPase MutS2
MGVGDWLRRLRTGRDRDVGAGPGAGARASGGDAADSDAPGDEFDPFPEPVRLEITDTIDLHAFAPRDVRRAVKAYLEEAHRAGFRSVRIIHGRGRYVQRAAVRAILQRTPFVRDFTDAPPERGGLGATVAHLKAEEGSRQ